MSKEVFMTHRACLWSLAGILVGGGLLAQVPASERIPITNPDRLEALGFPRDARSVFEWARLDRKGVAAVAEKAAAAPETFGSQTGFTTVMGIGFQKALSGDSDFQHNLDLTFCSEASPGGAVASAQVQLPEGAALGVLHSWAVDSHPDRDLFFQVYEICQEYGYDGPVTTLIAENQTLGAVGNIPGSKSLGGLTVNNHLCGYTLRVQFADTGESCVTGLGVRKFEITWNRQVSPAPASATFGDVPTSHPFFQFVEALSRSGITGGCGGGNYCPDEPLTRGQMAVFLAKALGLQWPIPQ
jgi:hypothetical protein